MEFKPLTCGDQPKIRFLVVDDSVFARKNICKMVEAFGGEIAGEAGWGGLIEFSGRANTVVANAAANAERKG